MTTLEKLIAKVRASGSMFDLQFTLPELAEGLQDAASRIGKLEAAVKRLERASTKGGK